MDADKKKELAKLKRQLKAEMAKREKYRPAKERMEEKQRIMNMAPADFDRLDVNERIRQSEIKYGVNKIYDTKVLSKDARKYDYADANIRGYQTQINEMGGR